jgi:hypothetical protein
MKYYIIPLSLVLFVALAGHAQTTISFGYDDSGNRNLREVISLKSATTQKGAATDEQDDLTGTSTESLVGMNKVRIYPNPTRGVLRIDFPALMNQKAMLTVYGSNGRVLINQQAYGNNTEIDLSNYPGGFYIMRIVIGQEQKEWKILKD